MRREIVLASAFLLAVINFAGAQKAKRGPTAPTATTTALPIVDVKKTCQIEAAQAGIVGQTAEACLNDQDAAKQELANGWASYPSNDKQICLNMATKNYLPGYVELLTCVEMFQYARTPVASEPQSTALPVGQRQPRLH